MRVLVARVGKAHGLRGEVTVRLHTDSPSQRFTTGTRFDCDPSVPIDHLTVASARVHNGVWLLGFEEITDRTAAEAVRGVELSLDAEQDALEQPDSWYESELIGLEVVGIYGQRLGQVVGLQTRTAQDLLEIRLDDGRRGSLPFVRALVPEVDVPGGRVVVDPPEGIFDLDTTGHPPDNAT